MIKEWLDSYKPINKQEALQGLREIMQEIALAGLYRTGFFEKAAFYGGTALRIFYNLDRFSEDLDFSLLKHDDNFSLDKYTQGIISEFESLGMKVSIKEKTKTHKSQIESAFLKSETVWKELELNRILPQIGINEYAHIKIKLEVDKQPPLGFLTEEKLLLRPFSFYVKCFVPSDLFAGKMHALLFRKWGQNVKGRDWYDLEWYIKKGIYINLDHLTSRAKDSGDWETEKMSKDEFKAILEAKINSVNMDRVKADIMRFIPNGDRLAIWDKLYFSDLVKNIKMI